MKKHTICLVSNWFPTKENPIVGCFFKEQAIAVADYFDFIVFRYQELKSKNPFKRNLITCINKENNITEFSAISYIPIFLGFYEFIFTFFRRKKYSYNVNDRIGTYYSKLKKQIIYNKITKLARKIKLNADIFYCVDAQNEAFNTQCLAQFYKKPFVIGEHAPVPWPGLLNNVNKEAIEKSNLFFAISNDKIRQMMLQNIKLPKTVYIGNMIDETKFKYKPRDIDKKTFIVVAANSYYKNYSLLIKVFNRLVKITDKDFCIMIVGYAANKGYSQNIKEFEKRIEHSLFYDKVELIPEVPRVEIAKLYNKADAFILTSIQEGQPVSALEAACSGLPIFSTRCGGVEDYVDNRIGRLYDINDYCGIASGLKDFVEGHIVFDGKYIRKKIVEMFGRNAFVTKFSNTIDEIIKNYA